MAERGARRTRVGKVTSNKMDKTVVVEVTSTTRHPLYSKIVRSQRKYYAHDETGQCRVGDQVRIVESRPMSKLKRWRVLDVVEKARE